jgi:hypothetical protein
MGVFDGKALASPAPVRSLAVLPLLLTGACAFVAPPSYTTIGTAAIGGDRGGALTRFATGVHLASAVDTSHDVGVGYTVDLDDDPDGNTRVQSQGMYVEYAHRQRPSEHVRTSVGARAVLLYDGCGCGAGSGAFVRLGAELYGTSAGGFAEGDHSGVVAAYAAGAWGLGVYLDAGFESLPGGARAFLATTGLSVRLPFMAGFAIASR